jgi:hypothetical protein
VISKRPPQARPVHERKNVTMKRNPFAMRAVVRMLAVLTALVAGLSPQLEGQHSAPASRVVMYLVGRGFLNPNNGQGEIVGYITDIKGIPGSLFSGLPSESTAFFTFRSDIFTLQPLPTNGNVGLSLVTPGTFSLYLNVSPNGDWRNPDTFSSGKLIATFKRGESLFLQIGPASSHVLSESLVSSSNFQFAGKDFNLDCLANGVTFSEFISNTPLAGVEGFPVSLPFAANAMAVERRAGVCGESRE